MTAETRPARNGSRKEGSRSTVSARALKRERTRPSPPSVLPPGRPHTARSRTRPPSAGVTIEASAVGGRFQRGAQAGQVAELPFRTLLYRFIFFDWLFADVGRARDAIERHSAEQFMGLFAVGAFLRPRGG